MSLETALAAHLTAAGLKVYPLVIPQSATPPCVTYQRINTPRQYTMGSTATVANPRMQVDAWGTSYASAKATAATVMTALNQQQGTIGAGAQTFAVLVSLADNEADSYEPDTGRYRVRIDFRIMYEEGAG